ncbi:serine hydrolase [Enterococcus sp. 2201sp1_2201st1_B8_2201SCRN_220225]|uniref:serine hydrolase n=1 Tax=unclassified Enterococcus TaxID=2608891 RepID=UPI0034A10D0D
MTKRFRVLITTIFTLGFLFSLLPTQTVQAAESNFSVASKAAISVDAETGKIFYEQDAETPMGIASVTKIIGLYIVEEQIKEGKMTWEDPVTISQSTADLSVAPDLSNVALNAGEDYSVKELFHASLIASGNAAIVALGEKIAGSEPEFVDMMKAQVEEWGITDATLVNASGLNNAYLGDNLYPGSAADAENLMSAKDVAIVARHLIQDFPDVLEVSSTPTEVFAEGTTSAVEMVNWNWMLPGFLNEKEGVNGLKTGTTDLAGACFVGTMTKDNQRIITVVLNATNHAEDPSARFVETSKLMDYTFDNWKQEEISTSGSQIPDLKTLTVKDGKELSVKVSLADPVTLWVRNDMDKTKLTITPELNKAAKDKELTAPVQKGAEVGKATVALAEDDLGYLDNTSIPTSAIHTNTKVEKANFFVITGRTIKEFFQGLF